MFHFSLKIAIVSVALFFYSQEVLAVVHPAPVADQEMTIAEFVEQSPETVGEQLGRKLTFKERIGLRILRRKIRKQPELGQQDWRGLGQVASTQETEDDACDYIFLLDGTKLAVVINYLSKTEVTYELCNSTDQIAYTLPLSEVLFARDFRNVGLYRTRDRDKRRFLRQEILPNEPKQRTDKLAVFGVLSSLAGLLFLATFWPLAMIGAIGGVVLAQLSFRRYRLTSYYYDGKDAATIAMVVGVIGILLVGLVWIINGISF